MMKKTGLEALIVGDLMLDKSIYGSASRLTPEGPVPVIVKDRVEYSLGGAGFVSKILSMLEVKVTLVSIIGNDESSLRIIDCCESDGVSSLQILKDKNLGTNKKTRVYASGHLVARIDDEFAYEMTSETRKSLLESIESCFSSRNIKVCIISDYNKGFCNGSFIRELIKLCKFFGILALVDPKTGDVEKFRECDLIKPNENEAAKILDVSVSELPDPKIVVESISRTLKVPNVLFTRGSKGMVLFSEGEILNISANQQEVFNVVGAGDSVIAGLAAGILRGLSIKKSSYFANDLAGELVSKLSRTVAISESVKSKLSDLTS